MTDPNEVDRWLISRRIDAAIDMAIIRRDGISPGISLAPG